MGEKDISEKLLEDYNDVFADIINVLLFNGKRLVEPEALEDSKHRSQYKSDDAKLHEQERDVVKYWKEGRVSLAVYGLENQTNVDGQMPVRILGYEGANYRSQYGQDRIIPVVTLVLYFGTKHRWNEPTELWDIMEITEELKPYVNNCKINVVDVAWLTEEQLGKFTSDFGIIANFFVNKRKNPKYIPDDGREFMHTDAMLKFLRVMTGDSQYEELLHNPNFKKEGASMCSVVENLKLLGREEERIDAIRNMIELGLTKEQILQKYSVKEYEKAEQELLAHA